eukprot:TRINITY_DN25459_c0_g1_i1.p1 TRINITY_DN25459_c0_g1~~TRINITY_DN25459_c0_g1_i1.p1  ORF type:complete len:477 (+),score=91.87 TRINITY_DN25459_c0_g1_i1:89-1519(+)
MEVNLFSARMDMGTEKAKAEPMGVAGVELDDLCCESAFTIEGKYECKNEGREQGDEHFVTVTREGDRCYRWTNRKGGWWLCWETENPKYLEVDDKCPYYDAGNPRIKVKKCKKTDVIEGFLTPWGEKFEAVIHYGSPVNLVEQLDKAPYECHRYDGTKMKTDWHFVTIQSEGAGVYRWTNRAGVSWSIYETDDPLTLSVSEECPYFNDGHKECKIVPNETNDGIRALIGPGNEKYDVKGTVTAKVARDPDPTTLPRKYRRNPNLGGVKRDMTNADYIVIAKAPEYQKGVFLWSNSAGETWMVYSTKDPTKFKVDAACPYQISEGFRTMNVSYNKYGEVVSVEGPSGGYFEAEKCPPLKATFLTLLPLRKYECIKYNNTSKKDDWHYVCITPAGIDPIRPSLRRFLWQNRLGVEWYLYETQDPFIFEVDEKCCYFKEGHTKVHILIGKDGTIEALKGPWGDLYIAVDEFSSSGCCIA